MTQDNVAMSRIKLIKPYKALPYITSVDFGKKKHFKKTPFQGKKSTFLAKKAPILHTKSTFGAEKHT